jgi:hypothetical protein
VSSGEAMPCLFNPTELTEKLQVNWSRLVVPGLDHHVLQYQSTGNRQLEGVEFYVDRFFASEQPESPDILAFRTFLTSLTKPAPDDGPSAMGAPPRVLVVWPGVLVLEGVVLGVTFRYRQFAADGSVLIYVAEVTFEEVLDVRPSAGQR